MVWLTKMAECRSGNHKKCAGFTAAVPEGTFDGVICECACHLKGANSDLTPESEFWREIEDSANPEDFEFYVDHFPAGLYVELAQKKIARLKKK